MNVTSFFLARRILLKSMYQKSISTMTVISFLGIFIGSFSLALITAITQGYEYAIQNKMQGIHAQIIIRAAQPLNMSSLAPVLQNEFPEIKSFSPTCTQHLLLRANNDTSSPTVAIIKGIDPQQESLTSSLAQKITAPLISPAMFPELLYTDHVIIGQHMAHENNFALGDTIELLFSNNESVRGRKVTFNAHSAVVGGIFKTGIDEFDTNLIYCRMSFLKTLFPNAEIDQVNIQLHTGTNEAQTIEKLKKRLGLEIHSWKDLYPALFAALALEKYVTFFILALITLVASMNIISLLFMQITQKRPDIALLTALGMSHSAIRSIFFYIGMIISISASSCGLLAAILASWLLDRYPFIQLPDAYYVTTLPVHMNWQIIVAVFLIVLFFSLCATWFPAQRIKYINVSEVLRFEG